MKWLKWLLLIILAIVGLLALAVYLLFYHESNYRIVGRYVDYDCQPVAQADFNFRGSLDSGVPYGGGGQYVQHGQTDAQGYFLIDFDTSWRLDYFDLALSRAGDDHLGRRRTDWWETKQALQSDHESPFYVYRQSPQIINRRFNQKQSYRLELRGGGGFTRHRITAGLRKLPKAGQTIQRREVIDILLRWEPDREGWNLILVANKGGGFLEYPVEALPFKDRIPQQGYLTSISLRLPSKDEPPVRKAYYYRHKSGEAWGTLRLDMLFDDSGYGSKVLLNLVGDLLVSPLRSTGSPVLPQLSCGGKAPRGMADSFVAHSKADSYYGTTPGNLDPPNAQTAADPDTPLEWFYLHLDDPVVLNNALSSYGAPLERYPLIYESSQKWLRTRLEDGKQHRLSHWRNNPVLNIAGDERAPQDILERILADFPMVPVALALVGNPNLPEGMADRIAAGLLEDRYEVVDEKREEDRIIRALVTHSNLGRERYFDLTERLLAKKKDDHDVRLFLKNPAIPPDVLTLWASRALDSDAIMIARLLLSHPSTKLEDLERLSERYFREEYRGVIDALSPFLKNPNLSHDMLSRFLKFRASVNDRRTYLALLHPNFDRGVLYAMLTPDNPFLLEGLVDYYRLERIYGYGPKARKYSLPTEIIADIHALSDHWRVQSAIARNANTPPAILDVMIERAEPRLDRQLIDNASLTAGQFRILRKRLTPAHADKPLAANMGAPDDILLELADRGDWVKTLLKNPGASGPALERLYEKHFNFPDPFRLSRRLEQLLLHPNITPELMDRVLVEQEEEVLFEVVLRNSATDVMVLEKIYNRQYPAFADNNSRVGSKSINDALAAHPAIPWDIKRKLLRY